MIGICGASGYIGRALFKYLDKKGEKVMGSWCNNKCFEDGYFHFDLRENSPKIWKSFDYVVILSAYAKIQFCEDEKLESYWLNVHRTIELLNYLDDQGIPALFVSSDAAERLDTTYGRYKRMAEKHIDKYQLNAKYIRPGKINKGNIKDLCKEIYDHIKSGRRQKVKA